MTMPSPNKVIVGIDFGFTHTGVAFAAVKAGTLTDPHVINRWPDCDVENKVPTKLTSSTRASSKTMWGFSCNPLESKSSNTMFVRKHFKLYLDREFLAEENLRRKEDDEEELYHEDIMDYFVNFLKCLRPWILSEIGQVYDLTGSHVPISFLFSIPTTWEPAVVADFEKCVIEAGFNNPTKNHSAEITLTEAHAAALYAALRPVLPNTDDHNAAMKTGNVLLVCDAGGGTTDVSLLKVTRVDLQSQIPTLEEVCRVEGGNVGSVLIDMGFKSRLEKRLALAMHELNDIDPKFLANAITSTDFQRMKKDFGNDDFEGLKSLPITLPGIKDRHLCTHAGAGIDRGVMRFKVTEIKELFDEQVIKIEELIKRQFEALSKHIRNNSAPRVRSSATIKIILAGGLGSSPYVRRKLTERFCKQDSSLSNGLSEPMAVEIIEAANPQMVVCRGLVLKRLSEELKISALPGWRARTCYGIEHAVVCDPNRRDSIKNEHNGKHYITSVKWLIHRNEFIEDSDAISARLNTPVKLKVQRNHKRAASIYHRVIRYNGKCTGEDHQLAPHDREKVCTLQCDLGPAIRSAEAEELVNQCTKQRRKIPFLKLKVGRSYHEIPYEVKIRVGTADLKFSLHFNDRQLDTGHHVPPVKWDREMALELGVPSVQDDEETDGDSMFSQETRVARSVESYRYA